MLYCVWAVQQCYINLLITAWGLSPGPQSGWTMIINIDDKSNSSIWVCVKSATFMSAINVKHVKYKCGYLKQCCKSICTPQIYTLKKKRFLLALTIPWRIFNIYSTKVLNSGGRFFRGLKCSAHLENTDSLINQKWFFYGFNPAFGVYSGKKVWHA